MIKFQSFVSGSSGNATFVTNDSVSLLVDCGANGKYITECMRRIGADPEQLSGILITHEHRDHIAGAGVLSRKYDLPIFATQKTWDAIGNSIGPVREKNIQIAEPEMTFEGLGVRRFSIPHDALDPVGYSFITDNHKLTIATDLGHVTKELEDNLSGSDTVIIEANHDVEMLKNGFYQEFFEAFSNALIPFQPPERYGRSILENSSFLASSANPDPATHGRGVVARLSGATAEFLEMWQIMFFGLKPFTLADGQLNLSLCPALPKYLVPDSLEVSATFLGHTKVTYHVPMRDDITPDMYIPSSWALISHEGTVTVVHSASLDAGYASAVRDGKYAALHVTLTNR